MIIAIIPLVVCIIGLLMWALSSNAIVSEAGKWCFIVGLFVSLLVVGGKAIKIG